MNTRLAYRSSGPPRRSGGGRRRGSGPLGLLPPGTRALLGAITVITFIALLTPARVSGWLLIEPETLPTLRLTALFFSGFVVEPMSAMNILILALFGGLMLGRQRVQVMWARFRGTVLLTVGLVVVTVLVGEAVLGRGYGVGWVVSMALVASVAPSAERVWGQRKLLIFSAVVVFCADLVGAGLLWLWPGGLTGLLAGLGRTPGGVEPLFHALIAVFALIHRRRQLSGLPFTGKVILYAVIALDTFDVLFVGAIDGLMTLAGVGAAVLLVNGDWHPTRLIARVRLAVRRARKKPRLTLVTDRPDDDGRTLH